MTRREQSMLMVLIGTASTVAVAGLFYLFYFLPSARAEDELAAIEKDIKDKKQQVDKLVAEKRRLERYRLMSLPGLPHEAQREYAQFLEPLLKDSGLVDREVRPQKIDTKKAAAPQAGKKAPPHKIVGFDVDAKGDLASLVKFLEKMDQAPIVHRIKTISIGNESASASGSEGRLNIKMTIEGLIVRGSEKRSRNLIGPGDPRLVAINAFAALRSAPVGLPFVPWALGPGGPLDQGKTPLRRPYSDMTRRNIFVGYKTPPPEPVKVDTPKKEEKKEETPAPPPGPDMRKYLRLVMIDHKYEDAIAPWAAAATVGLLSRPQNAFIAAAPFVLDQAPTVKIRKGEAFLRNRREENTDKEYIPLLTTQGYDKFGMRDAKGQFMQGTVHRIDERAVYFQVRDQLYGIHMGQSVVEAMASPLTAAEMKELNLAPRKLTFGFGKFGRPGQ